MSDLIRKPITWVVGAVLIALAAWWLISALTGGKRAKVEAQLNANRGDAAVASGKDAANTVADRASRDAATEEEVKHAQDQVRGAAGAAAADTAARDGLRRITANRGGQSPVQRPDPR